MKCSSSISCIQTCIGLSFAKGNGPSAAVPLGHEQFLISKVKWSSACCDLIVVCILARFPHLPCLSRGRAPCSALSCLSPRCGHGDCSCACWHLHGPWAMPFKGTVPPSISSWGMTDMGWLGQCSPGAIDSFAIPGSLGPSRRPPGETGMTNIQRGHMQCSWECSPAPPEPHKYNYGFQF